MDLLRVAYDQLYLPTILETRPDASQNPVLGLVYLSLDPNYRGTGVRM